MLDIGFKMFTALGVVLLTFGAAVFVAKRFFGKNLFLLGAGKKKKGVQQKSVIELEASRIIGQGRTLHVVKYGNKSFLIGSTAQNINLISEFDDDLNDEDIEFETSLRSRDSEDRESSLKNQLGEKLREIARV